MARGLGIGGLSALALLLGTAHAAEPESGWLAGAARVEITPAGPTWMAGYASRKTPSEGVEHPLFAKALALSEARGKTLLWISADIIGFDRDFTERVAGRIRER